MNEPVQPGPDDQIEVHDLSLKDRLLNRKMAIKLALGSVAALALGKQHDAKAAWIIGTCTYSRCVTCCTRYYYWAYRYRDEWGSEWCGTYQFDHARTCDSTCFHSAGCNATYGSCGC